MLTLSIACTGTCCETAGCDYTSLHDGPTLSVLTTSCMPNVPCKDVFVRDASAVMGVIIPSELRVKPQLLIANTADAGVKEPSSQ